MLKRGLLLGLVFLAACANKDLKLEVTECVYPDSPKDEAPLWVCGANVEGVQVSAVGSTQMSKAGVNFMIQQAAANARVALAQQINTEVQAMVKNYVETTGVAATETVDLVNTLTSKVVTVQKLAGTKVLKQNTSPNGTLYVLVGYVDKEVYQDLIEQSLNTSYNNQKAQWQRVLADKSFNELQDAVEKSMEMK